MSNIQISQELFSRLYAYFLMNRREPLQEQIIKEMVAEWNAMRYPKEAITHLLLSILV